MSQDLTIQPYIIDSIIINNNPTFRISDIRDLLLTSTMQDKSVGYVRMFVSKQLNIMVKQGLLTTSGNNRNKLFHKTTLFQQVNASSVESEINQGKAVDLVSSVPYIAELDKMRGKLNGELAMLIAEMDEYRSIMAQYPQTQDKVKKLHQESTQLSATLTGQITAISKTIDLLTSEAA
ncbi:hypothetical protein ACN5SO_003981 [Vibrio parahaemolyticus]